MSAEVRRAAEILKRGGLVAFPTETVYGLGADASNAAAMSRLYAVKHRPADHPVIVHFADARAAFEWAREVPESARKLAAAFWPGPLTLILKRSAKAADFVTGAQDTVGLRVPRHPVARALLAAFGGGVAAPSANRFARISPTTAAHVRADLEADVDCVLEGGASEIGIESTIVDLSGARAVLLRPGAIGREMLEAVLGAPVLEKAAAPDASPRHSGGLERHYAPRTPTRLVAAHALDQAIGASGARVAVLAFSRADARVKVWRRMPRDPSTYAQKLYATLRVLDESGCNAILVESPPDRPEWAAVNDRLRRACSEA